MNKKYAIVSIVLIALMCGYVFPSVRAWDSGNGVVASKSWNEFGPNLSTLWIHAYTNYAAEVAAMEAGKCDLIDMTLLPSDYATMSAEKIGGQNEFNFSSVVSLGIELVDWNDAFYPFNITNYGKAVSDILQIDKVNFVNTWVGSYPNGGLACYSPIPGEIPVNSNFEWYNPNTENIYAGGYTDALTRLLTANVLTQAPLAPDLAPTPGVPGGYTAWTWNFTAPFPMDSSGLSYNPLLTGWMTGGEGFNYMGNGANTGLYILTRSEDVRQYIGPEVTQWLGANFTWWYLNVAVPANLPIVGTFKADVAAAGGDPSTAVPYITCQTTFGTMADFEYPVMIFYCYDMYTAGYSYGYTPDSMLESYLIADSPQAYDWSVYLKDETCYVNTVYDGLETRMENATTIGILSGYPPAPTPGSALYYCWEAQMELMGGLGGALGPATYPYFDEVGYSPIPAADEHGISNTYAPIGSGFGNWYTYLNMYDTANSPFASTNAAQQGLRRGTLSGCNPLSSYTVYDFAVFSDIYDSLAISNPYNLSQLVPYIATSWSVGTWTNTGNGLWATPQQNSNITITMRMDDEWQDVPGPENRAPYTLDNGTELNGPLTDRFMTPLDVAFTYAYGAMGVGFTAFYTMEPWCMQIDHIVISNYWEPAWAAANPLGPTGYPWANETYIETTMGITPSTLAWPTWQYVTPPVNAYENTSYFASNLVQFSSTLGTNQVQIYSSLLIPWLIAYRALGYLILPMDIFSHIAEGAWATTDIQGNPWMTADVTTLDLEPKAFGGIDLEYGSSAWIMVDDPADVAARTWRLDAYVAGLTYGPSGARITTDHGFFLATPPPAVTVSSSVVGITGYKLVFNTTLANKVSLPLINYTWTYGVYPYNITSGTANTTIPLLTGATPLAFYTIPGSTATVQSGYADVLLPPLDWNSWIYVTYSFTYGFHGAYYTTAYTAVLNVHPGDIAGASVDFPYLGADGIVNIYDLGGITGNWYATVPSSANALSPSAIADINGDGVVNIFDLGYITSQWYAGWP